MMTLTPWRRLPTGRHPAPFSELRREMDRFLAPALGGCASDRLETRLDVAETEEAIRVRVELPGVDPEKLDIQVNGDLLTISGEKPEEKTDDDGKNEESGRRYSERRYGAFERKIRLSSPVDLDAVTASHEHGVVTITLPLAAAARPRRIEVK